MFALGLLKLSLLSLLFLSTRWHEDTIVDVVTDVREAEELCDVSCLQEHNYAGHIGTVVNIAQDNENGTSSCCRITVRLFDMVVVANELHRVVRQVEVCDKMLKLVVRQLELDPAAETVASAPNSPAKSNNAKKSKAKAIRAHQKRYDG